MELANYLGEGRVLLAPRARDKEGLLKEMVEALCAARPQWRPEELLPRVYEREQKRSTGFGKGLAVAHARVDEAPSLMVVVARPAEPIEWNAVDGQPVRFAVLVVGAPGQDALYLQILSEITKIWSREATRALLLSAGTAEELVRIVAEARVRTHPRP